MANVVVRNFMMVTSETLQQVFRDGLASGWIACIRLATRVRPSPLNSACVAGDYTGSGGKHERRRALAAARTYARIAPSVPHAQHMPSHIFVRLGLWQETIASNQAAEAAAKRFAAEMRLPGAWDEQLHAMDYLGYAWLQRGDDAPATQVQDQVRAIKHADPENFKVAYAYAAIPARAMRSSAGSGPWPRR